MKHAEGRPSTSPRQVNVGTGHEQTSFVLVPQYVALHGVHADAVPASAVLFLEGEGIAVIPITEVADRALGAMRAGPVYRPSPGTSFAIPTGRVFLRIAKGDDVRSLHDGLRSAGFTIESITSYAPHSAWLIPTSPDIGAALGALSAIRALDGVEQADPQMLMRRAARS